MEQGLREQVRAAAEERDPWSINPALGAEADLVNNSGTAKYNVTVKIFAADQLWDEEVVIPFVGRGRPARISFLDLNAEMKATITWHLHEDCSDDLPPRTITW
jgi:hypothetical protein